MEGGEGLKVQKCTQKKERRRRKSLHQSPAMSLSILQNTNKPRYCYTLFFSCPSWDLGSKVLVSVTDFTTFTFCKYVTVARVGCYKKNQAQSNLPPPKKVAKHKKIAQNIRNRIDKTQQQSPGPCSNFEVTAVCFEKLLQYSTRLTVLKLKDTLILF